MNFYGITVPLRFLVNFRSTSGDKRVNYRTDRFINNNNEMSIKESIIYPKQKISRNSVENL